jgi:carbonic anhydrase/acetyltransferase-like protein (isoleucine patch superfamily)
MVTAGSQVSAAAIGAAIIATAATVVAKNAVAPDFLILMTVPSKRRIRGKLTS